MPSIPIYALSSKGENLSALGSTFTYRFKTPLQIPSGVECTLSLYQASLWYVQPNISASLGNNAMVFGCDDIDWHFQLVFEDGLYSLAALQTALRNKLIEKSSLLTGDEITLVADTAQQKIVIVLRPTEATGQIRTWYSIDDFTMKHLLGFGSNFNVETAYVEGGVSTPYFDIGNETAKFNEQVSYFLMNCSLSGGSYDSGGNYNSSQIAQMFPIGIEPGSQLVHIPYNPVKCSTHCAGQTISSCTFSVTNQSGELQDMGGEEFSCLVVIEY